MTLSFGLGIALALMCAFAANLGFFFKYRGANAAPAVRVRHPLRSARALFASRWFTIGMMVAAVGWGMHVAALALAPMSVVQVALAAGVVLIAVMADRMFGFPVGRRQWMGLWLIAAALVLLTFTQPAIHGSHSHFSPAAMIAFEAGLFGFGGLLIAGPRLGVRGASAQHYGLMLATAAGVLFGVSDTAIKALAGISLAHGPLQLLVSPWLAVALAASVVAFYASALSLQEGEAVPVIAITGTAMNIAGIAGGLLVFGDPMPASALGIVCQSIGFVLVVLACALMPAPVRSAGISGARSDPALAPAPS
jgi:drug/metabolite transporter (DMT)-like permease